MATQAAQGKKLLAESKYAEAISHFTLALAESPTSPDYLIQRSTAFQRSKQYVEALRDAEAAIIHATNRAKRELIIQAQLRRGIALFNLERYADAKLILEIVKRKDEKEKTVDIWLSKTQAKLGSLSMDDEKSRVTVSELPDVSAVDAVQKVAAKPATNARTTPATIQATPVDKIRHEWYQNTSTVFITLLAKGVPKDKATIDISEGSFGISFPIEATGSTYDFTIDPLFAHIDPSKSTSKVLPSKIELSLVKATPGQKWSSLEGDEVIPARTDASDTTQAVNAVQKQSNAPVYPTSSKSGPKNWDKIASTDLKPGEDEEGDDAMKFFKQLYKDASPEVQRAMMKSYTESNGTALSTDWKEVSKKTVETLPPDGMEAKQWGR